MWYISCLSWKNGLHGRKVWRLRLLNYTVVSLVRRGCFGQGEGHGHPDEGRRLGCWLVQSTGKHSPQVSLNSANINAMFPRQPNTDSCLFVLRKRLVIMSIKFVYSQLPEIVYDTLMLTWVELKINWFTKLSLFFFLKSKPVCQGLVAITWASCVSMCVSTYNYNYYKYYNTNIISSPLCCQSFRQIWDEAWNKNRFLLLHHLKQSPLYLTAEVCKDVARWLLSYNLKLKTDVKKVRSESLDYFFPHPIEGET